MPLRQPLILPDDMKLSITVIFIPMHEGVHVWIRACWKLSGKKRR